MSYREDCGRKGCGHDKSGHHAEVESTGDVTIPGRPGKIHYGACLQPWCSCPGYVEPER